MAFTRWKRPEPVHQSGQPGEPQNGNTGSAPLGVNQLLWYNGRMEKTSVIVEGGGMRGMYAAGVLDCLIQQNLYWNNTYGVSAGACHALSYISRQFDRARRVNVNHVRKASYSGPLCILRYGTFFGFKYIFQTIPANDRIDWHTFFQNQNESRKYYVVATNAATGTARYVSPESPQAALLWLEASCSLPVIGKAVGIDGIDWFDGGISDSIPVRQAEKDGHSRHIIILTQPAGYRKSPVSRTTERVLRQMYRSYPALIETNLQRWQNYNETLDYIQQLENEQRAFVFRPASQVVIGRLSKNREALQSLYEAGYHDACTRLPQLVEFAPST